MLPREWYDRSDFRWTPWLCESSDVGPGTSFESRTWTSRVPPQVSIAIHARGVCTNDLWLTTSSGQPTPAVLGHEGTRIVTAIGEGVDSVAVADRVVLV